MSSEIFKVVKNAMDSGIDAGHNANGLTFKVYEEVFDHPGCLKEFTKEMLEYLKEDCEYAWFVAEMSDSYKTTLEEQKMIPLCIVKSELNSRE